MSTGETGRRERRQTADTGRDPRLVAAIAAVLATLDGEPRRVRFKPVWPQQGAWRTVGRRDSMRGGWPW